MAKVDKNSAIVILVIIGIVVLFGAYAQKHTPFLPFSILTSGNVHNTDCSFLTNINSTTWSISDYTQGWIALDVYNYNQKNVFGYFKDYNISDLNSSSINLLTQKSLGGFNLAYDTNNYIVFVYDSQSVHGYKLNYNLPNIDLSCGDTNTNTNTTNVTDTHTCCGYWKVNGTCQPVPECFACTNSSQTLEQCQATLQTACTMEAKLCSDGSYVGRNASNSCQFNACPTDTSYSSWLTKELWNINGFSFQLWMVFLLLSIIVILSIISGGGA